jgi:hypothetical protein
MTVLAEHSSDLLVFMPLWLGRDDRIIIETQNGAKSFEPVGRQWFLHSLQLKISAMMYNGGGI